MGEGTQRCRCGSVCSEHLPESRQKRQKKILRQEDDQMLRKPKVSGSTDSVCKVTEIHPRHKLPEEKGVLFWNVLLVLS